MVPTERSLRFSKTAPCSPGLYGSPCFKIVRIMITSWETRTDDCDGCPINRSISTPTSSLRGGGTGERASSALISGDKSGRCARTLKPFTLPPTCKEKVAKRNHDRCEANGFTSQLL